MKLKNLKIDKILRLLIAFSIKSRLFSVFIKEPLDFPPSAFIHKSALIRTVKFAEISENGIRYVPVSPGRSSGASFRLLRRTLEGRSTRVNSCATEGEMRELVLFIHRKREAHTPRHSGQPFQAATTARPLGSFLAWAHLKRVPPPALVATARGSHSAQLHNRRPRRKVHLTLQIHNSLTLCRAKRPAASVPH